MSILHDRRTPDYRRENVQISWVMVVVVTVCQDKAGILQLSQGIVAVAWAKGKALPAQVHIFVSGRTRAWTGTLGTILMFSVEHSCP